MPDTAQVRDNRNFVYDPFINGTGENVVFKFLEGTPALSSNKLRLNDAAVTTFMMFRFVHLEVTLNVATAPTAGHARFWGFKSPALGNRGRIGFEVADDVFQAVVYNEVGVAVLTKAIAWDATWTATDVRFAIRWDRGGVWFLINEVVVGKYGITGNATNPVVPRFGLPFLIDNDVADNTDMTTFMVRDTASLT